jgi:hypothetical protein
LGRFNLSSLGDRPFFFPAVAMLVGAALGPTKASPIVLIIAAVVLLAWALWWARRVGSHLLLLAACGLLGTGLATLHSRVEVPPGTLGPSKIRLAREFEAEYAGRARLCRIAGRQKFAGGHA